jgi:hypothetical protein
MHEKSFRGNFWLTSTARLFALEDFLVYSGEEVLHLESDVVISNDFPFGSFKTIKEGMAFPIISKPRGVASVLYLRESSTLHLLNQFVITEAEQDAKTTEMLILRKFYDLNREKIRVLPIGPESVNCYRQLPIYLWDEMKKSFDIFGGCFDGVDIGQYFFGTDPRNRRGRILIRRDLVQGYADISEWILTFSSDRKFPEIRTNYSDKTTRLYSLHLPSKRNTLFIPRYQTSIFRTACEKSKCRSENRYSAYTFVSSIIKSVPNRIARAKKRIKLNRNW